MNDGTTVTQADIEKGLCDVGLQRGDLVLAHSSLSAFGHVEGGAQTVIAALQNVIGETGTLLLPSFNVYGSQYDRVRENLVIFDVRSSPSLTGKITDCFWRLPGVLRSLHPTHSVAACGPLRDEIISGHEKCRWACGIDSPLFKLKEFDGKILLLGVGHRSNTFIHTIEDTGPAPSTSTRLFEPKVVGYNGETVTVPTHPHLPSPARNYEKGDAFCKERGFQNQGMIGKAEVRLIQAAPFYKAAQEVLATDPVFFLNRDYYAKRNNRDFYVNPA